jgi:sodium transport system permease protein
MRTHIIKTIVQKDITQILRDKKTLYLLLLMPFFLYPILFAVISRVGQSQKDTITKTKITVWLQEKASHTVLYDSLKQHTNFDIKVVQKVDTIAQLKRAVAIDLLTPLDTTAITSQNSVAIKLYYDENDDFSLNGKKQIQKILDTLNQYYLNQRLAKYEHTNNFLKPLAVETINSNKKSNSTGQLLLGYVPAILLFFIFMGAVYTAIDLTAGEKERKTLQAIYAAPLSALEIVTAKFGTVFTVAMISATANLLSLGASVLWIQSTASNTTNSLNFNISIVGWVLMFVLLILMAVLISAVCLSVMATSNSYKEASSLMSPMMLVLMIPAFVYQLPAMELSQTTSFIPLLNVFLSFKTILKGTVPLTFLCYTVVSLIGLVILAMYATVQIFSNESIITGEKVNYQELLKSGVNPNNYFGASQAVIFSVVTLLVFLYIGLPLQINLTQKYNLVAATWGSIPVVLGGMSMLYVWYYKLPLRQTFQLYAPRPLAVIATVLMGSTAWVIASFLMRLMVSTDFSREMEATLSLLDKFPLWVVLATGALVPAIFEEMAFRGVLLSGLRKDWSKWGAILFSSLMFGLIHLSFERLFNTTTLGILMAVLLWNGRSIFLASLFHFLNNGIAFTLFYYRKELTWAIPLMESNDTTLLAGATAVFLVGLFLFLYDSEQNKQQ